MKRSAATPIRAADATVSDGLVAVVVYSLAACTARRRSRPHHRIDDGANDGNNVRDPITSETTTTTSMTETTTLPTILFNRLDLLTETPVTGSMTEFGLYEPTGAEMLATVYNPYDYQEISVQMTFVKPSGETLSQYAFWFKEYAELQVVGAAYDTDGYLVSGQEYLRWKTGGISHYRVRITPDETGVWEYVATVTIAGSVVQTLEGDFEVGAAEAEDAGFIRIDPTNGRTFVFDSGASYLPIGTNLGWWNTALGSHDYYNWFKSLAANGGNYARIWLANWSFSLHKDSYDNFDTRQSIAIRIDNLLELAAEADVYIMLTLLNHGTVLGQCQPEWDRIPTIPPTAE